MSLDVIAAKALILALVVLAGTLCIFLGYRLYVLGVVEKGRVDLSVTGGKLQLKDYGPGVVFALFGAGLLIFVVQDRFVSERQTTEGIGAQPVASPKPDNIPGPAANAAPAPSYFPDRIRQEASAHASKEAQASAYSSNAILWTNETTSAPP